MTIEKPTDMAHVWLANGTETPIDVYINYSEHPRITDVKALRVDTEYQVKGKDDTPYGTYTFSARAKDRPRSQVLAAVSIDFSEGRSFTAVFHQAPDHQHRFSVYENDFTPSDTPRMTVRHTARPPQLTWWLTPKDFKSDVPSDDREGTLSNGQWQVATNVIENDYVFEVLINGHVVAEHPDLELEHEKDRTVYVVGDPYPTADTRILRRFLLVQEFQLPPGARPPSAVTPPAEPYATTDRNDPIVFDCQGLTLWQTNRASTGVSAIDPDGVITDLALAHVNPHVGGILIPDHGVTPASSIGGQAVATVDVLGDVPPGDYAVTIVTNMKSQGERATCTLSVTVLAITIERVLDVAAQYEQAGLIDGNAHAVLVSSLEQAEQELNLGQLYQFCQHLKDALALVSSEKNKGIAMEAAEHLERELHALRAEHGCG